MIIKSVDVKPILNIVGEKTIEAVLNNKFKASAPSGTSKGMYEKKPLPVEKSISNFRKIKRGFLGNFSQKSFDNKLKKNMKNLGSNMTTALSLSFFYSSPPMRKFPKILGNVIGGGAHAKSKNYIQEILVTAKEKNISEAIKLNLKIWKEIGKKMKFGLSYESAWVARNSEDALKIARKVADDYSAFMGVDIAASQLYKNNEYHIGKKLSREKYMNYVKEMRDEYELFYIEDPLHEDDFYGFKELRKSMKKTLICGDDIIATDKERFEKAIKMKSINAVIIKPNQIGTVSESLELIEYAKKKKIVPIVSHRSGCTDDVTISRLALYTPFAKLGVAGIRTVKLNELARLWSSVRKPKMSVFHIP